MVRTLHAPHPSSARYPGMVVEYDQELLSPIGVVRDREQLRGRDVIVIEGGSAVMLVPKEAGEESNSR